MAQNALKEEKSENHVQPKIVKRNLEFEQKQIVTAISKQAASTRLHLTGRFKMNEQA